MPRSFTIDRDSSSGSHSSVGQCRSAFHWELLDTILLRDDGRRTIESLSSSNNSSHRIASHRKHQLHRRTLKHSNGSADASCRCSWDIDFDSDQAEIQAKHVPEMWVDLIEMLETRICPRRPSKALSTAATLLDQWIFRHHLAVRRRDVRSIAVISSNNSANARRDEVDLSLVIETNDRSVLPMLLFQMLPRTNG